MLNMETLKKHKVTGIWYRPETDDGSVISERRDYYALMNAMTDQDVVLDAGGHIGITACLFSPTVKHILTVEPDPDNVALLKYNLAAQDAKNVSVLEGALTPEDGVVKLWLNQKKGQCAHSLTYRRGRTSIDVNGYSFGTILDLWKPTFIKMDIEGGEYPLMNTLMHLPDYVRGLALELHFNQGDWRYELAPQLHAGIQKSGFRVVVEPEMDTNWRGTTPVYLRP